MVNQDRLRPEDPLWGGTQVTPCGKEEGREKGQSEAGLETGVKETTARFHSKAKPATGAQKPGGWEC